MRGRSTFRLAVTLGVALLALPAPSQAGPRIVQHFAKAATAAALCPVLEVDKRRLRAAMAGSDVEFSDFEPDGRFHQEMLDATVATAQFIEDLSTITNKPVIDTACSFGIRAYGPRGSSYAGLLREK